MQRKWWVLAVVVSSLLVFAGRVLWRRSTEPDETLRDYLLAGAVPTVMWLVAVAVLLLLVRRLNKSR